MTDSVDVVVVGAGIGGSAMSIALARAGMDVVLLEKTTEHRDVVRGEWMAPWGVREANVLGLTQVYLDNGAHRIPTHVSYDELFSREEAEAHTLDLADMVDDIPLCIGHPKACNVLNDLAVSEGVKLVRGIAALKVTPGTPPGVAYSHQNQTFDLQPRWVIGADGRNGVVADQIGCTVHRDPEHHLFSGMLVEDAHGWPVDKQIIATEGDANVLAFPQGGGTVRIYLGWPSHERSLLVGAEGPQRFLQRWRLDCVPHADAIAHAKPASRCIAYPNADAWVDHPVRPGVVLIGDAAGRNDPIIGQGLSITHRDVRMVRDILLGTQKWSPEMFDEYVAERRERMSRLRTAARLVTLRDSAFGPDGYALRAQIHERISTKPDLAAPYVAAFVGPDELPAEVFSDAFTEAIVGAPIWSDLP